MLPLFRPHPLFRGGHAQTLAGCYLPGLTIVERATRHCVELTDNDRIVLHEDEPDSHALENGSRHNRNKIALLVHGLGGSHRSGYLQRCTHKLTARGIRVFRMDLRGCGAGVGLARYPVHAGRSQDVGAALEFILRRYDEASVSVVGFSMGANLILKLLGEWGDLAPPRLIAAMAVAPPIDLLECSRSLNGGLGWLYDRAFLTGLVRAAAMRRRHVPDGHHLPPAARPRRLLDFDETFTAPVGGFAGAEDYYQRASAGPLLAQIRVPTLIVTAADDPIIPVGPFERATYSPQTKLVITPSGGHLGFIGVSKIDPDRRWLDWRILEWIEGLEVATAGQGTAVEAAAMEQPAASLKQRVA
ncbi:MAG: alpha/beta fold hydrolase [Pirellulaceae bacterium]